MCKLKISVITPSLNSVDTIKRAIESVRNQNYDNYEHIIIDGGSKDMTVDFLKENKDLIWKSEPDNGQSDAMNKGYKISTGDIIVYLNADDYFLPDAFNSVIPHFINGEKVVMGNILVRNEEDGTEWLNSPKYSFIEMLRHWEKDAFCVNPVGYFYKREVQENLPFSIINHDSMDLEFLLNVRLKYAIYKIDKVLGVFLMTSKSKTSKNISEIEFWSPRRWTYIETLAENNLEHFEFIDFIKSRDEGYKKRQDQIIQNLEQINCLDIDIFNKQKQNLNPHHNKITNGISIFTALKDRSELFENALKTWINIDQIDEIVVVDWSSKQSIRSIIDQYQNGKIVLVEVKDQEGWTQPIAFNLAARFTTKNKILKIDADVEILKDFFEIHILSENIFYTGNFSIARNENESHLNGCAYLYRNDFFKVNGYNEFFRVYGYDDTDLYNRLESIGLKRLDFNLDWLHHIEHEGRTVFQSNSEILRNLTEYEWARHSILMNRYNSAHLKKWSIEDEMLAFKVVKIEKHYFTCVQAEEDQQKYSSTDIRNSEIDAIKWRLRELGFSFLDENDIEENEYIQLFNLFLSKDLSEFENQLYSLFFKTNRNFNISIQNKNNEIFEKEQSISNKNELIIHKNRIIHEKESILNEKYLQINDLEAELEIKEQFFTIKDNVIKKQGQVILDKEMQISQLEDQIKSNGELIKESLQQIADDRIEIDNLKTLKDTLTNVVRIKDFEIETLTNNFSTAHQTINALQNEIVAYKKSISFRTLTPIRNILLKVNPLMLLPKLLRKRKRKSELKLVSKSTLFDSNYYLANNSDVVKSGMNPALHYLLHGGFEGRNPSEQFDSAFYLGNNPDVKTEGLNPLVHYISHGEMEGRLTVPKKHESAENIN